MSSASDWYLAWLARTLAASVPARSASNGGVRQAPQVDPEAQRRYLAEQKAQLELQAALRATDVGRALRTVEELVAMGLRPPHLGTIRQLLEDAAKRPDAESYAKALKCCHLAGVDFEPMDFARLLGRLLSRDAPPAQVRATLNLALPKDAAIIPLVPTDIKEGEWAAVFEGSHSTIVQEDGERIDEAGAEGVEGRKPMKGEDEFSGGTPVDELRVPEALYLIRHEEFPELNGEYVATHAMPEVLDHERQVYVKVASLPSSEVTDGMPDEDLCAYFWQDALDRSWRTGWYVGNEVGGEDVFLYNPSEGVFPPRKGWQVILPTGRCADPGEFVLPTEVNVEEGAAKHEPEEVEKALSTINLEELRGGMASRRQAVNAYFGHFVALLHLERLTEINTFKRRLVRHPIQRLSKQGWAIDGLKVNGTFLKRTSGKRTLPGWPDLGSEFIAFDMPSGVDLDRLRFKRGESVLVSTGDHLTGRLGEGTVVEVDTWKLVVNLNGNLPADGKSKVWRVYGYANTIGYVRQMQALLQLATLEKLDPLCDLLVEGGVGKLDAWAALGKRRVAQVAGGRRRDRGRKEASKVEDVKIEGDESEKNAADSDAASVSKATQVTSRCAEIAREDLRSLHGADKLREAQDQLIVDATLNDSQREAIEYALTHRCSIIQGPPGTGKTHVSVRLIQMWTKILGCAPILATSDSNVAVDNIAEGLNKVGVKAVRLGRPEKVRGHIEDICVDTIIADRRKEKRRKLKEEADEYAHSTALAAESAAAEAAMLGAAEAERLRLTRGGGEMPAQKGQEEDQGDDQEEDESMWCSGKKDDRERAHNNMSARAAVREDDIALGIEVAEDEWEAFDMEGVVENAADVEANTAQANIDDVVSASMVLAAEENATKLEEIAKQAAEKAARLSEDGNEIVPRRHKKTKNVGELENLHKQKQLLRKEEQELRMEVLRGAEVICTTTMSSGGDMLKEFKFKAILIDEVAQATEISAIVPIIMRGATQLVLVGDHCQLPPSVLSREAELRGLSLSIYGRLVNAGLNPNFLDTQYRSHPKIAEFSAQCFYNGGLKSGVRSSQRVPPMGIAWPNPEVPVCFVEVGTQEELDGESKANSGEVRLMTNLLREVIEEGELSYGDIGVVTPYMAQVRALRKALRSHLPGTNEDLRLLEIASVDNFQGREKELIVFSAVRSNRRGNVGFLADWRRLNVMLTRARRGLVVFGNSKTLRHDCHWQQWLEWCQAHGGIVAPERLAPRPQFQRGRAGYGGTSRVPPAPASRPPTGRGQIGRKTVGESSTPRQAVPSPHSRPVHSKTWQPVRRDPLGVYATGGSDGSDGAESTTPRHRLGTKRGLETKETSQSGADLPTWARRLMKPRRQGVATAADGFASKTLSHIPFKHRPRAPPLSQPTRGSNAWRPTSSLPFKRARTNA